MQSELTQLVAYKDSISARLKILSILHTADNQLSAVSSPSKVWGRYLDTKQFLVVFDEFCTSMFNSTK